MNIEPSSTLSAEFSTSNIDRSGVHHKRLDTRANLFTTDDVSPNDYAASVSIFRHYTGEPTHVVVLDAEEDIKAVLQACVNALTHVERIKARQGGIKEFRAAIRSQNTNAFGLRHVVFVAKDGTAFEAYPSAYSGDGDIEEGHTVNVPINGNTGKPILSGLNWEMCNHMPKAPQEAIDLVW